MATSPAQRVPWLKQREEKVLVAHWGPMCRRTSFPFSDESTWATHPHPPPELCLDSKLPRDAKAGADNLGKLSSTIILFATHIVIHNIVIFTNLSVSLSDGSKISLTYLHQYNYTLLHCDYDSLQLSDWLLMKSPYLSSLSLLGFSLLTQCKSWFTVITVSDLSLEVINNSFGFLRQ